MAGELIFKTAPDHALISRQPSLSEGPWQTVYEILLEAKKLEPSQLIAALGSKIKKIDDEDARMWVSIRIVNIKNGSQTADDAIRELEKLHPWAMGEATKQSEKKPKESGFLIPAEMTFAWLKLNATYENMEKYAGQKNSGEWTQEEFEFLYPFLLGKLVIEDEKNGVSYGAYIKKGVHDCFDFATGDAPKKCKEENGFGGMSFGEERLRELAMKAGLKMVYNLGFPFLSFDEVSVFYLRPGDIIGTQISPNSSKTHWAVVGIKNNEALTVGFTGRLQPLTVPDFFGIHNSNGFDVIRQSPDFEYGEVIRVAVTKSGGKYSFGVEIVPRGEMDKSAGRLGDIGYFIGRD